ncbi:transglycosylase SLT domain-containing protein [Pseudomonas sp. LRF_L74]|uniref:transglycosylase SLT domain-containing protein n=1 Tax=Pseudomonas sp. LRF_L74 TaxID=3369422 RepID=UPI003F624533
MFALTLSNRSNARISPCGLLLAMGFSVAGCSSMTLPSDAVQEPRVGTGIRWLEVGPGASVEAVAAYRGDDDLWARMRRGFALARVEEGRTRIDRQRRLLLARPSFIDTVGRSGSRYLHFIIEELDKRQIPLEIALLPAIESGYNPLARSSAEALGLWQFMPSTGRRYALRQRAGYDERRDIPSSTRAAMDYLGHLHGLFEGDWLLALAAYNAGEGRVQKEMARNRAKGLPTDYWHLSLPEETRDYVPRLLALAQVVDAPQAYGVNLAPVADRPYFEVIALSQPVNLAQVAALSGVHEREVRLLNAAGRGHAQERLLLPITASRRLNTEPGSMLKALGGIRPRTDEPIASSEADSAVSHVVPAAQTLPGV